MEKSKRLSIDSHRLENLRVNLNPAWEDATATVQPRVEIDFNTYVHASEHDRFAVSLYIKSVEPVSAEQPLTFAIRLLGYFRLEEPIVEGKLPPERAVNGLTILYGIARGYLGTAAAWFNQQLVLPTVYFSDLVADRIESEKHREVTESPAPVQIEAGSEAPV